MAAGISSDDMYSENFEENRLDKNMQPIIDKIQNLRVQVSSILNRPTVSDATLAHECYYSRSSVGAFLPRHMDERHEELKGPRGWMLSSRRSISWLIYLSDVDLIGGQLRTFPQENYKNAKPGMIETGSHNGNLQIGWIDLPGNTNSELMTLPVYLDSWFFDATKQQSEPLDPRCILYTTLPNHINSVDLMYITKSWSNDSIQSATSDFLIAQAQKDRSSTNTETMLFIDSTYANGFRLLEDRESWTHGTPPGSIISDITPKRGSLVMFDSVSVPHEVLKVEKGTRAALAGWFHEETQQFPSILM